MKSMFSNFYRAINITNTRNWGLDMQYLLWGEDIKLSTCLKIKRESLSNNQKVRQALCSITS